ncbi:inorganic diphosphatase [Aquicella lusitana]|mgnify:CR=1 FL=1|uniref:Inorganic pyrophosphatase n=1 Tax=Aquicella lusitana TaxID=254246 RepID=A0A370GGF8_9COXI|nr:inorganic diphosphatase [Aquicella lusitana]RDI42410.1 inorganic pyrophosphatase [Aquicella lusitana]VVC74128.1 Inorganic pyrophosphatase [Aquicella lusitana]
MGLENLQAGKQVPDDINVVIEIPSHHSPIKYEIDKESGMVMVDRFLGTAMFYPCEYGFVPHTLSEDGDPVDVLVISPFSLLPGSVIRCRPVGLLRMTDESGKDAKILAVPVDKLTTRYHQVHKPEDLGKELLDTIAHFFTHYKDLDKGKWAKLEGWEGIESAKKEIMDSIKRYQQKKAVA